jgi:hypothetical protein
MMADDYPPPEESASLRASLLDEWRAEVGDAEIARVAEETRRAADAGLIPSFSDRDSLLAYMRSRANRPG